jgi:hypothetical protein
MSDNLKDEGSRSLLADIPVSHDRSKREESTRRHAKGLVWVAALTSFADRCTVEPAGGVMLEELDKSTLS